MKTKTLEHHDPRSRLRMRISTVLAVVVVGPTLLLPHAAVAQYVIDLATQSSASPSTVSVEASKHFPVQIINRLPYSGNYTLTIERRVKSIPAFTTPALSLNTTAPPKKDTGATPRKAGEPSCKELIDAIHSVDTTNYESTLALLLIKLRSAMVAHPDCPECSEAETTIKATKYDVGDFTLRRGEELLVTIASDKHKWSTLYTTGDRGVWSVTYGFAIPWFFNNTDSLFITRTVGGKNVITASSGQNNAQVLPAIFVSWIPYSDELDDWSFGFGSGLSFDKTKPVLQLGLSITYNQNINVLIGALGEFTKVLLPQYHSGDTLGESLTSDQLHQDVFKIAPAIGISYRFDANPFK